MRIRIARIVPFALATLLPQLVPAQAAPWKQVERANIWTVDMAMSQCFGSRPMELTVPSQVVVGVDEKDIALTFENLSWRIPLMPDNAATMILDFEDGKPPIRAQVLLLSAIDSFQFFPRVLGAGEPEFWQRFRASHSLRIKGPFRPGRVRIDLGDPAPMLDELRNCVAKATPERKLPF